MLQLSVYLTLGRRALGLTLPWCPLPVIIASRVALILSDVIVLCFTWTATHAYRNRDILRGFGRTTTLAEVLYKNGAIYFLVLTTLNILYLVVILLEDALGSGARESMGIFADFITITYDSFTTILIVHFLVRLQEAACPESDSAFLESEDWEDIGTLQFARVDVDSWAREAELGTPSSAEVAVEEGT
ncbi:uncharacterized protein TRAVEDRAFT_53520 [Trametes versicolor FP-101664 SS1]|uniref:uncharacterized protein n=1 Tax=Trametes versicolor (strain FP-101664) TaxID=717944 RepID=UPI0004621959|nr:uncharacterized protein TRAVEDRAFT_53520 [Trametes versicolor FP-101664 SS1]EIW53106.1 hypothetical protein TRAVEDRAFT_53520 [Trametes versicolor FP-101664 SS1]